jgi:hypothetical protein
VNAMTADIKSADTDSGEPVGTDPKGPLFEVRESAIQGFGVFAARKIKKGTRIIEYTGERVSDVEAAERYDDEAMDRHHTFLFAVDDDVNIDAAHGGNEARYINHSCDPNCEAVNEDGRIFIEAKRTIQPGEELAYDYQYQLDVDDIDDEVRARYACRCGTAKCRGCILEPKQSKKKSGKKRKKDRRPLDSRLEELERRVRKLEKRLRKLRRDA